MKKLLVVSALVLLSGCATTYPCFNVQNDDTAHQAGVVVQFGNGTPRTNTRAYTCPYTIDRDLFNPPFPFDDNSEIK